MYNNSLASMFKKVNLNYLDTRIKTFIVWGLLLLIFVFSLSITIYLLILRNQKQTILDEYYKEARFGHMTVTPVPTITSSSSISK